MAKRATIRASDADREQIVDRLRTASTEGRLAAHELEHRVTTALKARTYAELDAVVADLPPEHRPGRRAAAPHRAVATVRAHPALLLVAIPIAAVLVAALVAITVLWSVFVLLMLVLGHGRYPPRGPLRYATRRRLGSLSRAESGRGAWF